MNQSNNSQDKTPNVVPQASAPRQLYALTNSHGQPITFRPNPQMNIGVKPVAIIPRSMMASASLVVSTSQERDTAESPPELDRITNSPIAQFADSREARRIERDRFEEMMDKKVREERRKFDEDRSRRSEGSVRISIGGHVIEEFEIESFEHQLREEEEKQRHLIMENASNVQNKRAEAKEPENKPTAVPSKQKSTGQKSKRGSQKNNRKDEIPTPEKQIVEKNVHTILMCATKEMEVEDKQNADSRKNLKTDLDEPEPEKPKKKGRGRWARKTGPSGGPAKKKLKQNDKNQEEEDQDDDHESEEEKEEEKEKKKDEEDDGIKKEEINADEIKKEDSDDFGVKKEEIEEEEDEEEEVDDGDDEDEDDREPVARKKKTRKRVSEVQKLLVMDFGPKEGGTLKDLEEAKNGRLSLIPRKAALPENRLTNTTPPKRSAENDDDEEIGTRRRKRTRRSSSVPKKRTSSRLGNKSNSEKEVLKNPEVRTAVEVPPQPRSQPIESVNNREDEEMEQGEQENETAQVAPIVISPQQPRQIQVQHVQAIEPVQSVQTVDQVRQVQPVEQVQPFHQAQQLQRAQQIPQVQQAPQVEQVQQNQQMQHVEQVQADPDVPESPPIVGRLFRGMYLPAGGDLNYRDWTVAQMFEWVSNITGSPVTADIFRNEEMDGTLIDYLSQDDLRNQLKLPFGPMMKLLRGMQEIKNLQRENEPK